MKYIRFIHEGSTQFGMLKEEKISVLDRSFLDKENKPTGRILQLSEVQLLAPVHPSKVVCIGLNYAKHIEEFGNTRPEAPIIFIKPSTSVIGPEAEIISPAISGQVDHEAELAVVIGKTAKDISEEKAFDYIFGYTCGNDVTARDLQRKDGQWTRGKSFDTFCPIGPWIVTDLDPSHLDIRALLNGQVKQSSNTRNFLNPVAKLVSFISQVMTLLPGDVILTGTPEGVGPMKSGDEIAVQVEGIGELRNRIR
ncbi:fumarylacetoacetate hydrolase family protein [Desulfitobacterium sp. Sab5]|uniref:fumarylacetoacetate hydrolase family protein n=1 Tax=Desulfitobacterium TaxID=36853 RepID=UPI003CFAC023